MVTKRHLSHSPCPAASIVVEIEKAENLENQFMLISPHPVLLLGPKGIFTLILYVAVVVWMNSAAVVVGLVFCEWEC